MEKRLLRFLTAHPECASQLRSDPRLSEPHCLERFALEVSRGKSAPEAAKIARKYASEPLSAPVNDPLPSLRERVARDPKSLLAGSRERIGEHNLLNFSSARPLIYAGRELELALVDQAPTTILCEPGAAWQTRGEAPERRTITLDPGDGDQNDHLVTLLNGESKGRPYARRFLSWSSLAGEHALQRQALRSHLISYLSDASFNAHAEEDVIEFNEEIAIRLVDEIEIVIDDLAAEGRLLIPIAEDGLSKLLPVNSWEENPLQLNTVIAAATGDNPLLTSLAAARDQKRIGFWGIQGQGQTNKSSATILMPNVKNSVVLKADPEVMKDTLYFPDELGIRSDFRIPASDGVSWRALADASSVNDLFAVKCLLQFLVASDESVYSYLRGEDIRLQGRDDTSPPLSYILSRFINGSLYDADGDFRFELIPQLARISVGIAAYRALTDPDGLGCIGALYMGPLTLDQVERVQLEALEPDEFSLYDRGGTVPPRLKDTAAICDEHDVELVLNPPLRPEAQHAQSLAELLSDEEDDDL